MAPLARDWLMPLRPSIKSKIVALGIEDILGWLALTMPGENIVTIKNYSGLPIYLFKNNLIGWFLIDTAP